jgi:hypothetical protein
VHLSFSSVRAIAAAASWNESSSCRSAAALVTAVTATGSFSVVTTATFGLLLLSALWLRLD